MKDETSDIEEKQQYLIEEILKKNYNADKFSDYMKNLKENGTELSNWTFDELKQVVQTYINQQNSNEINNSDNVEKEVENVRNSFSNLTKNNIKIPGFEDYEIIETSEFIDSTEDKIQCIKQKENSLTKHNNLYVEILK